MKIHIIEDDPGKADRIMSLVIGERPQSEVRVFQSYQTGLRALLADPGDLVILDVSLPTYDPIPNKRQGRPRPLGGVDIMRKLRRHAKPARVVVLTALENFGAKGSQFTFDELHKMCSGEFPEMFLGAIYYSQSRTDWQDELKKVLHSI